MAKDIKILIGGNVQRAEAAMRELQRTGKEVSSTLERDFNQLGIRSSQSFENQRKAATSAYDRIKASGLASTEELSRAEKALTSQLGKIDKEAGRAAGGMDKMARAAHGAHGGMGLFNNSVVNTIMGLGMLGMAAQTVLAPFRALIDTAVSMDRITNSLKAAAGAAGVASEIAYVRAEAARLGLELETAAQSFAQFSAAARGTSLEGEETRRVFSSVTAAATVMGLSAADTEGVLRALNQMISKGTVQAEELRGQLGERLPGAFQMAARAMGVSTQQLNKMLEQGQVLAVDLLPKLADELDKTFGAQVAEAARSTQAELNRLSTAWFDLKGNLTDSSAVAATLRGLTATVETLGNNLDVVGAGLTAMAGATVINNIGALTTAIRALAASTALATGGLTLVIGAAAMAGYWIGEKLVDSFTAADEAAKSLADSGLRAADGSLKMMASHGNTAASTAKVIAEAEKKAEEALKAREKALKVVIPALDRYARSLNDLGREQLRMAEIGFGKDMERQAEYMERTGSAAANLLAPIRSYVAVLDQVAAAQRDGYQEVIGAMEKIAAADSARLQAQINLQESVEKPLLENKRKAWESAAKNIAGYFTTAYDAMKKKEEELLQSRLVGEQMVKDLQAKASPAPEKNAWDTFLDTKDKVDELQRKAMAAANPVDQIRGLEEARKLAASLGNEVKVGEAVLVDAATAAAEAADKVQALNGLIEAQRQAEISSAAENVQNLQMAKAEADLAVQSFSEQIGALDTRIAEMTRTITLTGEDKVTSVVDDIQKALDALKDKTITVTAKYVNNIPTGLSAAKQAGVSGSSGSVAKSSTGSSSGVQFVDINGNPTSMATGAAYVPRTGLYQLHRGEEVRTRGEASRGREGATVTIAPVIQISGVSASGGEKTARELAREIEPELRKLGERYRG